MMMRDDGKARRMRGQYAVEFCLALPFILLFALVVVGMAASCMKGEILSLASQRVARAAKVFQDDLAANELYAMLPPRLFERISVSWSDASGRERIPNWQEGLADVESSSDGPFDFGPLRHGRRMMGRAPVVPALPQGLSDEILNLGDTPSPYCAGAEGYAVCGY